MTIKREQFYRIVIFSLIAPLVLLGVLCCHFSGMALAQTSCCSLVSSLTHSTSSSCDTSGSAKTKKCKSCDCFKVSGTVDQDYSKSVANSNKDSFIPRQFVLASSNGHYPALRFFNYQSPPKIVQNSFLLPIAVRPPPVSIL